MATEERPQRVGKMTDASTDSSHFLEGPTLMSEREHGPYGLLKSPALYESVQRLMGAEKLRHEFQRSFVRAQPGDRVLDVGCGPAQLRECLPEVEYIGFEPNPEYIARARQAFDGRATFHIGYFGPEEATLVGAVDIAIVSGVLHHMNDDQAIELFNLIQQVLKPGGRVVTVDPVFAQHQNPIARVLVRLDRGRHVRTPDQYQALARDTFKHIDGALVTQFFPPYTRYYMTLKN